VRITRIYTKNGDKGMTQLVGGDWVPKDHARVEATGTVDELNACIGMARQTLEDDTLANYLAVVQDDLFNVGADLSSPASARHPSLYRVGDSDVSRLEGWIDHLNADLPPLREFILPGGGASATHLHLGRTVCRRAERRVYTLMQQEEDVGEGCMQYLNRLSDLLFVAARYASRKDNVAEVPWRNPRTAKK
jgi:cob(I)alamin adenosyltransferase